MTNSLIFLKEFRPQGANSRPKANYTSVHFIFLDGKFWHGELRKPKATGTTGIVMFRSGVQAAFQGREKCGSCWLTFTVGVQAQFAKSPDLMQ